MQAKVEVALVLARDANVQLLELLGAHLGDGEDRVVVGPHRHHDLEQTRQALGDRREELLELLFLAELVGDGEHLASRARHERQELGDLVVVRLVELGLAARPLLDAEPVRHYNASARLLSFWRISMWLALSAASWLQTSAIVL